MDDQHAVLQLAVARLESADIRYYITGSIALAAYAMPRMTRDIDIVIDCDADQVTALAEAFEADSYVDLDTAREAARTRGTFNVIHNETLVKIDFFCRPVSPTAPEEESPEVERFARRRRMDLAGLGAFFSSPEDLVVSKLQWRAATGSEQQLRDVRALLGRRLDSDYLDRAAARLGLTVALREARNP